MKLQLGLGVMGTEHKFERKDIMSTATLILQMAASVMDSNEFLIHLLNRLCLIPWLQGDKLNKVIILFTTSHFIL